MLHIYNQYVGTKEYRLLDTGESLEIEGKISYWFRYNSYYSYTVYFYNHHEHHHGDSIDAANDQEIVENKHTAKLNPLPQ